MYIINVFNISQQQYFLTLLNRKPVISCCRPSCIRDHSQSLCMSIVAVRYQLDIVSVSVPLVSGLSKMLEKHYVTVISNGLESDLPGSFFVIGVLVESSGNEMVISSG